MMELIKDFICFTRYTEKYKNDTERLKHLIVFFYTTEVKFGNEMVSKERKMKLYVQWLVNYSGDFGFGKIQREAIQEMIGVTKEHISSLSKDEAKKFLDKKSLSIYENKILNGHEPSVFEKYLMDNETRLTSFAETKRTEAPLFSMGIIANVYKKCNGEQWEEVSEQYFYTCINNPQSSKLEVLKLEKDRFAHLIKVLSEKIKDKDSRKNWISQIEKVYYEGKSRINKKKLDTLCSAENREFADKIKDL
ncbi:hypothetical protein A9168_13790 [Macellibacteroides sp. HH-ZS]|nr:hypothetical protein A9168_13790 [Macellibacteroides sp. HH-ZS]